MHATVRSVIEAAAAAAEDVCILDTEASPEHLSRGTARYADAMLAVVEPYYKSLETGRRMAVLADDLGLGRVALLANKIRDEHELEAVREFAARMNDLPTLPRDLLQRGGGLTQTLEEICASHSLESPDGVTLLVMAHPQHAGTG